MKTLLTRSALVGAAAVLAFTLGCAGLTKAAAGGGRASAKSEKSSKDIAACEKMCAVAGDAEDNKAAVEKCQKKCH